MYLRFYSLRAVGSRVYPNKKNISFLAHKAQDSPNNQNENMKQRSVGDVKQFRVDSKCCESSRRTQ